MSERERALWQAIRRGLMLLVAAIDQYVGREGSAASKRYNIDRDTGSEARSESRPQT